MVRVIEAIVSIAILVHGYFYVRYGTADPCGAATIRFMQDMPSKAWDFDQLIGKRDGRALYLCYVVALLGPVDPDQVPHRIFGSFRQRASAREQPEMSAMIHFILDGHRCAVVHRISPWLLSFGILAGAHQEAKAAPNGLPSPTGQLFAQASPDTQAGAPPSGNSTAPTPTAPSPGLLSWQLRDDTDKMTDVTVHKAVSGQAFGGGFQLATEVSCDKVGIEIRLDTFSNQQPAPFLRNGSEADEIDMRMRVDGGETHMIKAKAAYSNEAKLLFYDPGVAQNLIAGVCRRARTPITIPWEALIN
jgi:hypothetical protein